MKREKEIFFAVFSIDEGPSHYMYITLPDHIENQNF